MFSCSIACFATGNQFSVPATLSQVRLADWHPVHEISRKHFSNFMRLLRVDRQLGAVYWSHSARFQSADGRCFSSKAWHGNSITERSIAWRSRQCGVVPFTRRWFDPCRGYMRRKNLIDIAPFSDLELQDRQDLHYSSVVEPHVAVPSCIHRRQQILHN